MAKPTQIELNSVSVYFSCHPKKFTSSPKPDLLASDAMKSMDFRNFLTRAFEKRHISRPGYSLRSFAQDIGMSPQKLNQILRGKSGLSPLAAERLAPHLSLSKSERELFITLVESHHHRSKVARALAQKKLENLMCDSDFDMLGVQEFTPLAHWYIMACFLLVDTDDFVPETSWIAKRLGISETEAAEAIDGLFQAGLLKEDGPGVWVRDSENYSVRSAKKSEQLQKYYKQLWSKAEQTLTEPVEVRDFSASVISFNSRDIDYVRGEITKFRTQLMQSLASRSNSADSVYCLSAQFFPLDKKEAPLEHR